MALALYKLISKDTVQTDFWCELSEGEVEDGLGVGPSLEDSEWEESDLEEGQ